MGIFKAMLFIILFSIIIIILCAHIHEVTHQTINTYYGCDSTIVWNFLNIEMYTDVLKGESPAFMYTSSSCPHTESQILAHSINEIVGYNIMLILELMFIFMVSMGLFIAKNKNITIKLHKKRKGAPNIIILK